MMSPLAVSTYLESPEFQFDVVIFDEASQVLPWDAIGAVDRGRQLVVAGDQKQLPPSTFFDRMVNNDDDSDDADDLGDFESVLDVLCSIGLPRKRLRWHYRSRREPLIAFSNHHFYDDDLVTFPSPDDLDGSTAVRFVHVPDGRWRSKAGFNPLEAKRTAELVLEHIQRHGSRSLGVITFNLRQQLAVLDELSELRKNRPDLESFFREDRPEPFFVKNLENVQGDECDRIILSVAYGPKEETGSPSMSFGPLNRAGGERRLNVAVTRSREAITLVSSIRSDYIDLNRTKSRGARLLRAYLDYAERGPSAVASESVETGRDFESPFEEAVARAMINLGFDVRTQIGCGGFRIDLAIVHPEHPGRYVLGIECDGATYHRTATARDRDRIRHEVLEELGWRGRLIRIWSTDWIRNPAHQVERIANAFREALLLPVTSPQEVPEVSPPLPEAAPIQRIRDFHDAKPTPRFANIEDVPDGEIARVLLSLAVTFGVTPREDLIKSTAHELGFARTGNRISARIESVIQSLVQQGRLRDAGDDRLGASS